MPSSRRPARAGGALPSRCKLASPVVHHRVCRLARLEEREVVPGFAIDGEVGHDLAHDTAKLEAVSREAAGDAHLGISSSVFEYRPLKYSNPNESPKDPSASS